MPQFLDHDIDLIEVGPNLYLPKAWTSEQSSPGYASAKDLGLALTMNTQTPWILSSGTKDLDGRPRSESASHSCGAAFDLAPMYSEDCILPEDTPLSCLAVNWAFLRILAPSILSHPDVAIVEGDHIHVLAKPKPVELDRLVLSVPTISQAYSLSQVMTSGPIPLLFDASTLMLAPKINSLTGYGVLEACVRTEESSEG